MKLKGWFLTENYGRIVNEGIKTIIEKYTKPDDRYVGVPTWGYGQFFEKNG